MATNVKILLRRGLRSELSGDTLLPGELGYTTDTNQLYVGVEEAINELRFDPFANAHAVIQSWLDSSDCPVANLTVDEDLVVADIPAGQIDNIISALNNYTQTTVFNSAVATFTVGELLTQYRHKKNKLTSPNVIPSISSITATFDVEGETITASAVTLSALLTTLQTNAAIKAANVIVEVIGSGAASKLFFCKIDGLELNVNFASGHTALGFAQATNTVALQTGYDTYANGKITASVPNKSITAGAFVVGRVYTILVPGTTDFTLIGSANSTIGTVFTATGVGTGTGTAKQDGTTTVTVELSEYSDYFAYRQEGTGYPYATAPDSTAFYKFGTPSTPDYSALTPAVDSTSIVGASDTRIGLFGSKRKNVEVLTEESRNQLFTNQHLKSYSASTGLRSDLYKKELAGTSGTFLSYVAAEATSFFIDYSLKQVGSSITFVRTGTVRMINGVPQAINLAKLTDTNVEVHQDTDSDSVVDANEMSNIVFAAAIDGSNIKINYTQDVNFTTEISYTVKRWTM